MHIFLNSKILLHFVKLSKDIKVPKEQSKFLNNIYFKATKNNGGEATLSVTNLYEEISMTIQTEVVKEGILAFERGIADLIPKDELIEIQDDLIITKKRKIKTSLCEDANMNLLCNTFSEDSKIFELEDKAIKELLEVKYALSKDTSKPVLNGIHIKKNEFSAVDGYRLSVRKGDFESEKEITFCGYKPLEKMKGTIRATTDSKYVKFDNGSYQYYTKLIDQDFIAYDKLIPRNYNLKIHLKNKDEMITNLKTYDKIVSGHKNQLITLFIEEDSMQIEAANDNVKITDIFECDNDTREKMQIAFNNKYLYELLTNASDDTVLEFTTNVNPVIAKSNKGVELLLPVRMTSNI